MIEEINQIGQIWSKTLGNIANQEVLKTNQYSTKTDMRPCIQIAMMRRQKTHPTAKLAHQKKHC